MSRTVDELQRSIIRLYPQYGSVPTEDRLAVALLAYGVDVESVSDVCPSKYTKTYVEELGKRYQDSIQVLMQKKEVRIWFELQLNEVRKMQIQINALKAAREADAGASKKWEEVLSTVGRDSERLYQTLERLLPGKESMPNEWQQKLTTTSTSTS